MAQQASSIAASASDSFRRRRSSSHAVPPISASKLKRPTIPISSADWIICPEEQNRQRERSTSPRDARSES